MIYDDDFRTLTYWPESIIAGQDSQVLIIRVPTPQDRELMAQHDERITVFVRETGSGDPFVELALNPIDLSALPGPDIRLDMKIHAHEDVGPFERIPATVGARRQSAAGWNA